MIYLAIQSNYKTFEYTKNQLLKGERTVLNTYVYGFNGLGILMIKL